MADSTPEPEEGGEKIRIIYALPFALGKRALSLLSDSAE
jgi:hypothetical protein